MSELNAWPRLPHFSHLRHRRRQRHAISSLPASDLTSLSTALHDINPPLHILSRVCNTTHDPDATQLAEEAHATFGRLDVRTASTDITPAHVPSFTGIPTPRNHRRPNSVPSDADFARAPDTNLLGSWARRAGTVCRCWRPRRTVRRAAGWSPASRRVVISWREDFASVRATLRGDIGLCGAFCVWLTKEKREWLSGRNADKQDS
ncbi:hypothetical protein AOQ84DRAFT_443845 [Glonium stellatum]|uniref:Uncharacterized protein n=1 Tax=Glonium stellatum TaxID=574774 RepID=A0A8E2EN61_9PEZI|nr:hypothetical protein AOQ84DRAFT_443845 [Glonium stellatum]